MLQTHIFQVFRLLSLFLFFSPLQADLALSHGAAAEARITYSNGLSWRLTSTVNHSSAQEAEQKALGDCREVASKSEYEPGRLKAACKIVATFKDKCLAVSTTPTKTDPGVGWAVGLDKEEAESEALRKCRATAVTDPPSSCRVRQSHCDAVQAAPRQEPGVTAPTYVPTPVQSMSFSRQEFEELKDAARTANQISMVVAFFSVLLIGTTIWWANKRIASVQSAIGRVHGGMTRMFTKAHPPSAGSSASGGPPLQLLPSAGGAAITLAASRLGRSGLTIGRDGSCDIVVSDSKVSSRHARIWSDETGKLLVEDLGSSNGVYRNGEKILRASLRPGDVLRLGDVTYTVN